MADFKNRPSDPTMFDHSCCMWMVVCVEELSSHHGLALHIFSPIVFAELENMQNVNNALVGELPSFGMAKESKFQHLMQRNQNVSSNGAVNPHNMPFTATANSAMPNKYDTSLSVEAKAFRPGPETGHPGMPNMPSSMANTMESFEALNLQEAGMRNMHHHHQQQQQQQMPMGSAQPNPAAREFIPRNGSAPNLGQQQNGGFAIPEFIPNRPNPNRMNDIQQAQAPFFPPHNNQFPMLPNMMGGRPDPAAVSGVPRMPPAQPSQPPQMANNTASPMPIEFMPGAVIPPNQCMDPRGLSSSVFASPASSSNSSVYFSAENSSTSSNVMSGFTPATSSPFPPPRQQQMEALTQPTPPDRSSPLLSRRLATHQRASPSAQQQPQQQQQQGGQGMVPVPSGAAATGMPDLNLQKMADGGDPMIHGAKPLAHENGGTTYFYTENKMANSRNSMSVMVPSFNVFPGSPPNVEYMTLKANAPSFFMPNELRQEILHRHTLTMLTVDTENDPSIPAEVDNYHSLFPLEPIPENPMQKSATYCFVTSCFKAIKYKDGLPYCLRRIHGFRQVNEKCMVLVEMWKKLQHANVVQLREVFTSKAFGEHSMIFAHDYYAGAETMMTRHFRNPNNNYASKAKWNGGTVRQNAGLLPESLIWTYVVQLTSALRCIHTAGLACRVVDPTKILITNKSRIRINGVGIFDVLSYDNSNANPRAHMQQYQQEDLVALGKVVLALACNSMSVIQRDNFHKSIELVVMNYSNDLKNLILYLLSPQQRPLSVNDVMPMIGARFYTQLDAAMLRCDVIENELSKEVENGRLLRLLAKLGVINERPEFGLDSSWSETGDRYLLKLFRDHVFHQVTETGAPWIDLAHITQCLNKLDAGVPEKVCLMSRDEQNVLVVSYAELKKAFVKCFEEMAQAPPGGAE